MLEYIEGRIVERLYYSPLRPFLLPIYKSLHKRDTPKVVTIFDKILIEIDSTKPFERAIPFNALEPKVTKEVIHILKLGDTVIDIGAWIGYYSIIAASKVGQNGRVVAVEPSSENLARLGYNVALNKLTNVEILATVVGEVQGHAFLEEGMSSSTHRLSTEHRGKIVEMTTVDKIVEEQGISSIGLVILDVEGHEYSVLKGALRSLSHGMIENLICEVHPRLLPLFGASEKAVLNLLEENGYRNEQIDERKGVRPFHIHATPNLQKRSTE